MLATLYGTLDDGTRHPAVAIAGAMVLAAGATLALAMPVRRPDDPAPRMRSTPPAVLALSWGSAEAALIHFAVVPQHLEEYWLYGWFFVVVGLAQLVSAFLVIARVSRGVLLVIAAGNLAIAALWVLTRTYGAVIGPDATEPAGAGFGDIVVTVVEIVIAVLAVLLAGRSARTLEHRAGQLRELVNLFFALGLTLVSMLAFYSTVGGRPFVTHVG